MNLAIDLGNTRAKLALFNESKLLELEEGLKPEEVLDWVSARKPSRAIIASVSAPVEELRQQISSVCPCLELSPDLAVPVKKNYQTPQTLGADRLAAVVGGKSLFPGVAVLVIDAGSCITYDYVDGEANYLGGAIAPGLQMRFKAVHNFTARLPLIDKAPENVPLLGQSTAGSLSSGIINGICAEIEGMIQKIEAEYSLNQIIICGGDSKFFETKINRPIFVIPELVLIGLNEILRHNVPN